MNREKSNNLTCREDSSLGKLGKSCYGKGNGEIFGKRVFGRTGDRKNINSCNCNNTGYSCANVPHNTDFDNNFAVGISYVPWQSWKGTLGNEAALKNGTVFEELVKKFAGKEGGKIYG